MVRRRHKWIWRQGGNGRVRAASARSAQVDAAPEGTPSAMEQEAARVLREWREHQLAVEERRQETAGRYEQRQDAPLVAFAWEDGGTFDVGVSGSGRVGVDGVRERLRGRGEI